MKLYNEARSLYRIGLGYGHYAMMPHCNHCLICAFRYELCPQSRLYVDVVIEKTWRCGVNWYGYRFIVAPVSVKMSYLGC